MTVDIARLRALYDAVPREVVGQAAYEEWDRARKHYIRELAFYATALLDELEAARAEVERLRQQINYYASTKTSQWSAELREATTAVVAAKVSAERAAIVAWLRTEAGNYNKSDLANWIERGDHHGE